MALPSLVSFLFPNFTAFLFGFVISLLGVLVFIFAPVPRMKIMGFVTIVVGVLVMFALSWLMDIFASVELTVAFVALVLLFVIGFVMFKGDKV